MSDILWDPRRDHRADLILRATLCCWHTGTNLQFWAFLSWQDHFQLQSTSHSFHIACVDIVIFLVDSDSDSDVIVVPVYNPQDADG
jgi:hypothetical protein